jgi:hypothetical protein
VNRTRIIVVLILVVVINLPLAGSTIQGWQVDSSGKNVVASLTKYEQLGSDEDPKYWLAFKFDKSVDKEQQTWIAQVDRTAYERAQSTHQVQARVLPGHPSAYRVAGQVHGPAGLIVTLLADLALVGFVLLGRRYGRKRHKPAVLRVAAIEDIARGPTEQGFEQVAGDLYLVRGEVLKLDEHEVWIDAGQDVVIVILDGHTNPVGYQQAAQVRGRLVG